MKRLITLAALTAAPFTAQAFDEASAGNAGVDLARFSVCFQYAEANGAPAEHVAQFEAIVDMKIDNLYEHPDLEYVAFASARMGSSIESIKQAHIDNPETVQGFNELCNLNREYQL
ncbi:hypothetical protein MSG34_19485 [Vibrio sp. 1CM2L]|uniref:hypothetical protein n=1 Tax=Vibrio sp. 1CM2L TaxID=2929166 RepID=UPI0020BDBB3F|nr:hypothetical protein [Vibrio sp. 1CM2L]MCK8078346.1 hypothetical protein [Vibrio sp. 1CM2L]